jgi:hypothetical protein
VDFLESQARQTPGAMGWRLYCDDLYTYSLRVKHLTGTDQISADDTDLRVSLMVAKLVPDVGTWQYAGDVNGEFVFKFLNHRDMETVQQYLETTGYHTKFVRVRGTSA